MNYKSKSYNNIYENVQEIDNTDGFINVLTISDSKDTNNDPFNIR